MIDHDRQQMRLDAASAGVFLIVILIALVSALAFVAWGVENMAPGPQAPTVESVLWKPTTPMLQHWAVYHEPLKPSLEPSVTWTPGPCAEAWCGSQVRLSGSTTRCWCGVRPPLAQ
jgi:hypothetical protein